MTSYKLRVEQDDNADSPREWDNVGITMAVHRRYTIGDEDSPEIDPSDFDDWEAIDQRLRDECGAIALLPLYLYDHSGLALSTTPFSCPWDSGRVGTVYATKESVAAILGSDADDDAILQALRVEVEAYDQYLRGDIWGYVVEDRHGNVADSCWGFYGQEYATEQGEHALRYLVEHEPQPCAQPAPVCFDDATPGNASRCELL